MCNDGLQKKKKKFLEVCCKNTWEDTFDWAKEFNANLNNIHAPRNSH